MITLDGNQYGTARRMLPPIAIRLTHCEQLWVDDVRAGRLHTHRIQTLIHNRIRGYTI